MAVLAEWLVITAGGSIRFNLGLWSWWLNYHLYDGHLYDGLPEDEVCCSSLLLVISVILFCNVHKILSINQTAFNNSVDG